jgi:hypothetical protein
VSRSSTLDARPLSVSIWNNVLVWIATSRPASCQSALGLLLNGFKTDSDLKPRLISDRKVILFGGLTM